jgi:hypothetical protein
MTVAGVNKTLMFNMFHSDFKYHLKAIDALNEVSVVINILVVFFLCIAFLI